MRKLLMAACVTLTTFSLIAEENFGENVPEQMINGDLLLKRPIVKMRIYEDEIVWIEGKPWVKVDGLWYEIFEMQPVENNKNKKEETK